MPLKDKVKIYALINPINDKVFYIGATMFCVRKRMIAHVASKGNKKSAFIFLSLKEMGIYPEVIELDEVDFKEATFYEQFYMDLFRFYGFDLCNGTQSNYNRVIETKYYYVAAVEEWEKLGRNGRPSDYLNTYTPTFIEIMESEKYYKQDKKKDNGN